MNKVYKTSEKDRARKKAWYEANPEKVSAYGKAWYEANKESISARRKEQLQSPFMKEKETARKAAWYEVNKEAHCARARARQYANKDSNNSLQRARYASDIPYKLSTLVKDAHLRATGRRIGKQEAIDLLGCTLEEYQDYLESKFQQGMTWDNHAVDGWHIDHILPLNESGTTLTEEEKIKRIHYTNTQPLWAKDNMKKGNKLEEDNDV